MDSPNDILKKDFSDRFVDLMKNRIVFSHYKYGWLRQNYPEIGDAVASLEERLAQYKKTGNTEWLVDVANFAMIEFMLPRHPDAHFRDTNSEESPGIVGGSYNEMMAEVERGC